MESKKSTAVNLVLVVMLFVCLIIALEFLPSEETTLTADDLAKAQGISWWTMTVPPGMEKATFGLRFKTTAGTKGGGGCSGLQPGEKFKVFICAPEEGQFRYTVLGDTMSMSSSANLPDGYTDIQCHSQRVASGSEFYPGKVLIKYSNDSSIGISQELKDNEVGLTFDFE
ncbi:MAG: hypothetical protein JXA52_04120 [Planctomycetes bacterium]|nr:hypothetical protein [Planctomycetota bacterium]